MGKETKESGIYRVRRITEAVGEWNAKQGVTRSVRKGEDFENKTKETEGVRML